MKINTKYINLEKAENVNWLFPFFNVFCRYNEEATDLFQFETNNYSLYIDAISVYCNRNHSTRYRSFAFKYITSTYEFIECDEYDRCLYGMSSLSIEVLFNDLLQIMIGLKDEEDLLDKLEDIDLPRIARRKILKEALYKNSIVNYKDLYLYVLSFYPRYELDFDKDIEADEIQKAMINILKTQIEKININGEYKITNINGFKVIDISDIFIEAPSNMNFITMHTLVEIRQLLKSITRSTNAIDNKYHLIGRKGNITDVMISISEYKCEESNIINMSLIRDGGELCSHEFDKDKLCASLKQKISSES